MTKIYKLTLCVIFIAFVLPVNATPIKPEKIHMMTTLEIIKTLQARHYENIPIDNELSSRLFQNYIDSLDSGKNIFLQKEVDAFRERFQFILDDKLKKGDINAGFEIFNLYRDKNISQLESIIEKIPDMVKGFDYNKDETLLIDDKKKQWPKTQNEIDEQWRKRIKASALSLKLSNKDEQGIIELLSKRYTNQLERLKKINAEDIYQLYINAFTELYDPHTNYMSPKKSENFDIQMSLKLEGIGALLNMEDEYTKVVRLIHAGPADKEGSLQPSDRIVGVAQGKEGEMVDVIGWRLDEVVELIRGPKGSIVRLNIIPAKAPTDADTEIIQITRDEVKLEEQAVQKAMIDIKDDNGIVHKIGILDIPAFYIDFEAYHQRDINYRSTTRDTAKLLNELVNEGAEGIVIDLRNNGGGSLREANELTGLFIEKGPSVQIKSSGSRGYTHAKQYFSPYYDGPLVVLVNRMSASASEIFAGAIQDYQRGIIVGSRSFGKGTVQSLLPLDHGKLKVTSSKFYRVSGESTQHRGVIPDIKLPTVYDEEIIGESALETAMPWDSMEAAKFRPFDDFSSILPELKARSSERTERDPDFVLLRKQQAYNENLDLEHLSLNEKTRIQEKEKDRAARLAMINENRVAKGEKPLKSLDEETEDDAESEEASEPDKINLDDPFLVEASQILVDTKQLMKIPRLAK